jgi:hypothetical protein
MEILKTFAIHESVPCWLHYSIKLVYRIKCITKLRRPLDSGARMLRSVASLSTRPVISVISGFRRDVDENFVPLGLCRRFGTRHRSHLYGSRSQRRKVFFTLEDGTETLSRNVGKGLPFDAV